MNDQYNSQFNDLSELEKMILTERYVNRKTIFRIAKEKFFNEDYLFKIHNKAVLKLMINNKD